MGNHAKKKQRIDDHVSACIDLLNCQDGPRKVLWRLRQLLGNSFYIADGSGRRIRISPRYFVQAICKNDRKGSEQLTHLFIDALLEDKATDLEYQIDAKIQQIRSRILNLNLSSHHQREELSQLLKRIQQRKGLIDELAHQPKFPSSRKAEISRLSSKLKSQIDAIHIAEAYIFPDQVSRLRCGRGNQSFSVRSSASSCG